MKYFRVILLFTVYVILYVSIYTVHIKFFTVDVVFYAALFDAFISAVIISIILFLPSSFFGNLFDEFEKFIIIIVCVLVGYNLSISVPTVLDRSLSFYFLEKIDQNGGINLSSFEEVFTKEYAKEHRLVDVRLTEQLISGTLVIQNGCVTLTKRGKNLARFSIFFRKNFLPKKRLLMGKYTDALTDPFRDSKKNNYKCK